MRTKYHYQKAGATPRRVACSFFLLGFLLPVAPLFADEDHGHDHHEIDHGHADIGIGFADGVWDLHIGAGGHDHDHDGGMVDILSGDDDHDHEGGTEYAPDEAAFVLNPLTAQTVPADPQYSFLGSAGTIYYVAPQDEADAEAVDTIFLGINAEEIATGIFENDEISLELTGVTGPGDFFGYEVDGLGSPNVLFNSADGLPDTLTLGVGSHRHLNWAFTQPGDYELTFLAYGTLDTGGQIGPDQVSQSDPAGYTFEVIPEPSAALLLLLGLLGFSCFRRAR